MAGMDQPSWWTRQALGVVVVALWLILLACLALLVRRRWPSQREWSRKLVHIGGGAVVPLAWLLEVDRWVAVPAAAAITVVAAINHRHQLLPAIEDVGRPSYGTVAYGASITLLLLALWPQRSDAVCAGVLVMAVGDGLAGLVGPLLRSPSWILLGQRRSLLGTLAMLSASLLVLVALAAVASGAPALPWLLAIALIATVLEQVGWGGIDNLSVPLVVGALWRGLSP